jgi:hypothetical protein
MLQENIQNIPYIFYCELCDYGCCKKSLYSQHLNTSKHKNATNMLHNATDMLQKNICDCGKQFQHHSSYYRHKKKCTTPTISVEDKSFTQISDEPTDKQLIMMLIKENSELKNMMLEVIKNGTHNTTTHTNSHNKSFNLQFFLNETCKDAMNIMDFVDSVKLQLSDLENVGKIGFVEGISNIIIKNLNSLDETKRPVHCTDSKREIMYIKDENKWEKENEEKKKLRKAIKHIAHKNSKMLNEFKTKHPDCGKSDSRFSDQYNKLVIEAMGGKGDNDLEKEDKIIKNIAKIVTIDKTNEIV